MDLVYDPATGKYTKKEQHYFTDAQVKMMMDIRAEEERIRKKQEEECMSAGLMGFALGWLFFGRG